MPVSSLDWLAERAARTPAARALERADVHLDYGELHRSVSDVANALERCGLGAGDRLAVACPDGVHLARAVHAARRLALCLVPLNRRLTAAELAFQLEDAGAALLLHDPSEHDAVAAATSAGVPHVAWPDLDRGDVLALSRPADPALDARAATLIYTSGTTGRPKGALLAPANFEASAIASAFGLGSSPQERWLACLPLFHVGGLSILWRSVLQGSTVVVHDRFEPERVADALMEDGVSALSLTATMLVRLLDVWPRGAVPPELRFLLLGGGPCPQPLHDRALANGFPVALTYGLTEATSQVATSPPERASDPGLIPLWGTEVRVVDAEGRDTDTDGEIWVRGPTVMRGYWNRPEATAETLRDGWLRTGDLGRWDAQGRLHVLERRSDLIVSGGENVYPAEIEAVLSAHPQVAEVGVAGRSDERWGQVPWAWIVARDGASPTGEELEGFCRARLAGYKVPAHFETVSSLPRTAAGKLQRQRLGREDSDA